MPATEEGGGPNCGKRRSMRRRKDKGKRDGGGAVRAGACDRSGSTGKKKKVRRGDPHDFSEKF